jgi:hypothetical protein
MEERREAIAIMTLIASSPSAWKALFFATSRKNRSREDRNVKRPAFAKAPRDSPESFRGWRRGELNPCPRRFRRKHLHAYPVFRF